MNLILELEESDENVEDEPLEKLLYLVSIKDDELFILKSLMTALRKVYNKLLDDILVLIV
jgi:hypothetical protein